MIIASKIWIAFSGGLDSSVLLDMCFAARLELPNIHVVHIHHGLSPNADAWASHCANVCKVLNLDFRCIKVNLASNTGKSLEEAAREARYQVFADLMQTDDLLLTAHHQDDQAETVLLQLMRGAGPKGLSAMPALKPFAHGHHGRPLLSYGRADLEEYARRHHLCWIEDESNHNLQLTRNFIRKKLLPLFAEVQPGVVKTMTRSAQHCAEAQQLLTEAATEKLAKLVGSRAATLSVAKLNQENRAWQRLVLRTWIEREGYVLPDTDKLENILATVLTAAHDKMPLVTWGEVDLRRYGDDLYLLNRTNSNVVDMQSYLQKLCVKRERVSVRHREQGESVTLTARGKIALKNLFQEWRVPTWERSRLPLVFCDDKLILVPGYYADSAYFL